MDQSHITEEEVHEALDGYRWALNDALSEAHGAGSREEVIAIARNILEEDDPDKHQLIVALAESDAGEPVWNLEEEIVDDEETVASGEDKDSSAETDDED